MALRKGHCYTKIKRANVRHSKFRGKDFVKAIPTVKIVRYNMGDATKKYKKLLTLVTEEPIQIRHNSLESARQVTNRRLHTNLGLNYYFKINIFPHHVLRENKVLTGAGADRMQTGMQKAFGKAIGTSARLKKNTTIFSVSIDNEHANLAREALSLAIKRLPGKFVIKEQDITQ